MLTFLFSYFSIASILIFFFLFLLKKTKKKKEPRLSIPLDVRRHTWIENDRVFWTVKLNVFVTLVQ